MAYLNFIALTNGGVRIDSVAPTGTRILSMLQRPLVTEQFYLPPSFCEFTLTPAKVAELKTALQNAALCVYGHQCPPNGIHHYDAYVALNDGEIPTGGIRIIVHDQDIQIAFARHPARFKGASSPNLPSYYFPLELAMASMGQKQLEQFIAAL